MKMGKYLYGIIGSENRESFGNIGISSSEVYTIQYEDVGAVVSDIPEDYEIDIQQAVTHEKTLRKVMKTHTIIPVSFGVITKNEAEIENILKRARMKFKNTLEKIDNKLQINVKISWDNAILAAILGENEELRTLSREAKEKATDQSLRIKLGRKVKSVLDERKNEYVKNIYHALRSLSDEFKENKTTDQDTVMNASFLVDRKREQEFYNQLDELEKKYEKKLKFLAVGPLPPYNFTESDIKKMNFNMVEEARKTLGLGKEVSLSEINSAYDQLARKYHPDLNPEDPFVEEKFKRIKNARDVLTEYCQHYLCSLEKPKVEETLLIREKG